MKTSLLFLRVFGLLLLCLSTSLVEAKWCIGSVTVSLKQANGTLVILSDVDPGNGDVQSDVVVSLAAGDTILLQQTTSGGGMCGQLGLSVRWAPLGDTANYLSPLINAYPFSTAVKIAQRGSFLVEQMGVDFGLAVRLFIDAPQVPVPMGLLFTNWHSSSLGSVASGDTCSGPCFTAYLTDGQFVRLQAISGGLAQEGGNVVVRFAADGDPLSFNSPATLVPMVGCEGYQFSTDGMYLLSVEGPMITGSAYAYVHVSHLPTPRVDMSLTIERADGSSEEVAYIQPGTNSSILPVDLGLGDTLRIDHYEITEPCEPVRLKINQGVGWGPTTGFDTLIVDTPSTSAGFRMVAPGSYRLRLESDCGIPTAGTRLTINAPTPQLDLVISLLRENGTEEELFRSHVPTDPIPHLEALVNWGDSVRVHYEEVGYCGGYKHFSIHVNDGPEDATVADPYLYGGIYVPDISFVGDANYLIHLEGGGCYTGQDVHLHVVHVELPELDLRLEQVHPDGTSPMVLYAVAGGPMAFGAIELAPEDSIKVRRIVQEYPCTGIVLKAYRSEGDTATTMDPLFLDQPIGFAGLTFRETGSLLFTLEDTCGAITASAHLSVSEALSTGITTTSENGFNAFYASDQLLVDTKTGGLLEVRNVAGQLVRKEQVVKGARHLAIPFSGQANGVYIATLRSASRVDVMRFVVH